MELVIIFAGQKQPNNGNFIWFNLIYLSIYTHIDTFFFTQMVAD